MMTEKQLKCRRDELVDRVNHLVVQIPLMQKEETACRGQIQLISEMLGEVPPPPGAIESDDVSPKKPNAKPKRKGKAGSHGK
jgi:hypothetical protein